MPGTKVCTKCGQKKPATNEYFRKSKDCKNGLYPQCKECESQYHKEWLKNISDEQKEAKKQYYQDNKEYILQHCKKYRDAHRSKDVEIKKSYIKKPKKIRDESAKKEKKAEYNRQWSANHKEHKSDYNKQWLKNNHEKRKILDQKRRAKKKQLPASLTEEQWQFIKKYFNNSCCYCGKGLPLQQEHFIPLSKGGAYTHNNIIPACGSCNASKKNKDFFTWYPKYRHYSQKREKEILKFLGYDKQGVQQLALTI